MRAMLLEKPASIHERPLRLVERPTPVPGEGELVLRVLACGVCRTDLQLCEGDVALRRSPIIPGHQIVGRVVAVGRGVLDWSIGDRVGVAWLGAVCTVCERCHEERENLCAGARFTGWDLDGGYATETTVQADFALHLPESFTDVEAAPLLCGGIIGYRSLKLSGVRRGQRLGLFGFGASALLALQVAQHWGCSVYVCTRSESEQARARSMGAVWAGGYDEPPPARLDAVVTFAPVGRVVISALKALERGGTVAINAIHLDEVPSFDYDDLWWERSIRSVANFTRQDAREFLALAGRIPLRTTFDVFPFEEANAALERLDAGQINGAAVLRMPG